MARTSRKGLKICCGVTGILLVITIIIFTTLALTVFKPKRPEIITHPIGLENIQFGGFPNMTLNITLGVVITIDNRNYGSFKFKNTTANVNYHGTVVAEVPIEAYLVPPRAKINITTTADLMADKLIANPSFKSDLFAGSLNMTSTAVLHGIVGLLKILKLHATAYSTCDISLFIKSLDIESHCKSKIKV